MAKAKKDLSKDKNVRAVADLLMKSAATRTSVDPIAARIRELGADGAYAVQDIQTRASLKAGRKIVGQKIGLTSQAVQKQLGVDTPDYGMLFHDMAYGEDEEIPLSRLMQPRVEAEIAFVLERDIDNPKATISDAVRAIAYALPGIEVVDSRIKDWKISLLDTVADNASSGVFVLGGSPKKIDSFDLRLCGMNMEMKGES
ncbi:MAG: 2-keto-4-pentenoate hydratase, partial [Rhodospirillaceae bacterium]|nr:2-keto-4-pentenoate hydratase [Rhodospirillaceae bacterium]